MRACVHRGARSVALRGVRCAHLAVSDPEVVTKVHAEGGFTAGYTLEGPSAAQSHFHSSHGDARPLVVTVHGCPGTHRDYRYLGPYLEPNFMTMRLDVPGFGGGGLTR